MEFLEGAYTKPAPGAVDLIDDAGDSIRFRMLMPDGDWRNKLGAATT